MTTSILTTLSDEKIAAQLPLMSREATDWLRLKVQELKNPHTLIKPITKEKSRFVRPNETRKFLIGGMYFFVYDPIHKDTLPYYDRFPLVIPLKREADGFLGLNLHYLPVRYRIQLMRKLLTLAQYDGDDIRRLRVTYDILAASSRYREMKPCIKRYVINNIKSRIIKVESQEWDTAIFLPVHQFRKAKAPEVWKESVEEIKES